jgi:hypothetical protein
MSVFHENMLIGSSGQGAPAAAGISRSLRFNSSDSAYLSRTPASAGNRKIWTLALWVKRSNLSDGALFHSPGTTSGTAHTWCNFSGDTLQFYDYTGSVFNFLRQTAQVFRDPSAWYHLVFVVDTDNGTAANRARIYVNGSEVTTWTSTSTAAPGFSTAWNNNALHQISSQSQYFNGYLADIYFIDGQALTPTSFTETDATTGQLIPKAYTGSYGSQGWHLEFADNSSNTATTLGKDTSGNGNNWTPNNLSVTAGAGNDSLVDVPTNGAQTDTGVGGEVRGNYCTLNPLKIGANATLTNGNLDFTSSTTTGFNTVLGTIGVSSGKWYWEITATSSQANGFGIATDKVNINDYLGGDANGWMYYQNTGSKYNNNTAASYGSSYTTNDVIGFAFDADAGTITAYKNGVSLGVMYSGLAAGTYFPAVSDSGAQTCSSTANFGQRPFAYTAPSGFKALCTANLPAPLVTKPSTVMDVKLYTGTGSSQSITGLGFSPDFVWFKNRSGANSHALFDTVRGRASGLFSDSTGAEQTSSVGNDLSSFDSAGFTVGTPQNFNSPNINGGSIVAWTWDAGTTTVTNNTAGTITPTGVRANATAGFSVVTFTAQSSGSATIGHGLGVEPHLIIVKSRAQTYSWLVYHKNLTSNAYYLILNSTAAQDNTSNAWNSTTPTSTVFTLGSTYAGGGNSVAYCFAPVVGYSSFGSYTGNGSSDGPFVYTGFRPAFVMLKESSASGNGWEIRDSMREPYNDSNRTILLPNLSNAEITDAFPIDFTSSGFKVRNTGGGSNNSGATYIYAAFAESPFNYARAR